MDRLEAKGAHWMSKETRDWDEDKIALSWWEEALKKRSLRKQDPVSDGCFRTNHYIQVQSSQQTPNLNHDIHPSIDSPPAYDQYDEDGNFVSICNQLPPYSNDTTPSYCPPYLHVQSDHIDSAAFIILMGDIDEEVWESRRPPCDIDGELIQLYLGQRVIASHVEREERRLCFTRVVSYNVPHDDHIAVIVEQDGTQELHTLLVPNHYVDQDLLEVIYQREARGELELDWGVLATSASSTHAITQ